MCRVQYEDLHHGYVLVVLVTCFEFVCSRSTSVKPLGWDTVLTLTDPWGSSPIDSSRWSIIISVSESSSILPSP